MRRACSPILPYGRQTEELDFCTSVLCTNRKMVYNFSQRGYVFLSPKAESGKADQADKSESGMLRQPERSRSKSTVSDHAIGGQ